MNISSRKYMLLGKISYIFSAALMIAALVTNLIPISPVSAHTSEITGKVTCQQDNTKLVTWTITNSEGSTHKMEITAIDPTISGVGVGTLVSKSVHGTQTFNGDDHSTVTLSITGHWAFDGYTHDFLGSIDLGSNTCAPVPPDYQLNLSHIQCVNGQVEIHFVLQNVPDGVTPGTLSYTYGSIDPTNHTGNVWHYYDYKPDGYYNVTSASVVVNGTTVSLHNPGDYADTYNCGTTPPQANASVTTGTCSWTQASGSLTDVTITLDHASLLINEVTYTTSTTIKLPPGNYSYSWTAQSGYAGSGSGSVSIGDCSPGTATASVTISGACSWTEAGGSQTPVTIDVSNASLTLNDVIYTSSQTINLGPGHYDYTWVANQGYTGSGAGDVTIGDCSPGTATASATISGACSWTEAGGSLTPVAITLSHASLTINGVTYITSQTIYLAPGHYDYSWTANEPGFIGSGNSDLTISDCAPGTATASATISGACSWTEAGGSQTPVTIDVSHASLTINGVTYTTSQTITLGPGHYDYTWTADEPGYIGSGGSDLTIGACAPASASATISGACSWTEAGGSQTPVAITLNHASLTINGVTYSTSQTINLGPGHYDYTWTANESGYVGSGNGSVDVGSCVPPDAQASVVPGICSWAAGTGSITPVSYTLNGASIIFTKDGSSLSYGPFTTSGSVDLGPGSYSYVWTALSGYKGGGSSSVLIGDCTPGNASVSVSTGTCSYSKETGAQTPITITLTGASFTINGTTYYSSTVINLGPGIYPYSWASLPGYIGSGSGNLDVGNCNPAEPLVKTADPLTYSAVGTLISYTYEVTNVGNVSLTGIRVTDDKATVSCPKTTLEVNETMTCTATYSIVQDDLDVGFVTNHATSISDQTEPDYAHTTVTAVTQTGLTIDKTVTESTYTQVGDFLHYDYVVTNTGSVTLTGVGVTDDKTTVTCPKTKLAPAESMNCTATYSVSSADMESEKITNTAFASGLYGTIPVISAPDSATVVRFFKLVLSAKCAANPTVNDAWQVKNKNNYSVGFEYALDGGASGTGNVPANSTTSFDTLIAQRGTGVMSLYVGGNLQNSASRATGCTNNPPPPPQPTQGCTDLNATNYNAAATSDDGSCLYPNTPVVPQTPGTGQAVGTPPVAILIPVTGVDTGLLGRTLPGSLFGISFSFFGLGLVLIGLARRQED
ncbi:MAG: hypothetical protein ABSG01_12005 [Anaerolineales bacterium]|jgi:hypothetical protein